MRGFRRAASDAFAAFQRGKESCSAVISNDKFKRFNDTYGRSKSDEVLKTVADMMSQANEGRVTSFDKVVTSSR